MIFSGKASLLAQELKDHYQTLQKSEDYPIAWVVESPLTRQTVHSFEKIESVIGQMIIDAQSENVSIKVSEVFGIMDKVHSIFVNGKLTILPNENILCVGDVLEFKE